MLGDDEHERIDAGIMAEAVDFCRRICDPEELHAFAETWNWDKGTWGLEEVLANPACEAATALLIYWAGAPEFFLQYADRASVEVSARHALRNFDFLADIERRYVAGEFRVGRLAFDPANPADSPSGLSMVGTYNDFRSRFVRALPSVMYAPVRPIS
jgi:hypothetical protein